MKPIFVPPGEGFRAQVPGEAFTGKANGETTDGLLALGVVEFAARHGTPQHRHMRSAEAFWILEGTFIIDVDDAEFEAEAGAFAVVPPGASHRLTNVGTVPGRVLGFYTPAGPDAGFRAIRERIAELGAIPAPDEIEAILAANDTVRTGPARMRFNE